MNELLLIARLEKHSYLTLVSHGEILDHLISKDMRLALESIADRVTLLQFLLHHAHDPHRAS